MEQDKTNSVAVQDLGRELSMRMVMFHQLVAERFGLSATEHKCLDLLFRKGALTAGQLAEQTGLTSGAITKVVDRLEKAGFARRERSQADRRQVIIRAVPERAAEMGAVFASLAGIMAEVSARYSQEELLLIYDYLTRMIEVLKAETTRLKEASPK